MKLKSGLIALAIAGSALALGACADGYSSYSVGVSSGYDYGYDYPAYGYGVRRDRDYDGIPNRFDRDRDGDGISNRFDAAPNNPRFN